MHRKRPTECLKVLLGSDVGLAHDWAEILETREAKRSGLSRVEARTVVSRKTGVPKGKLYSLWRGRLKDFPNRLLQRLGAGVVHELQVELHHAEHDLQTLRQIGSDPRSGEVQAALASVEKIRDALGLDPLPPHGGVE